MEIKENSVKTTNSLCTVDDNPYKDDIITALSSITDMVRFHIYT